MGRQESHAFDEDAAGLAPVLSSSLLASLSPASFIVCSSSLLHGLKSPLHSGTILADTSDIKPYDARILA